MGILDKFFGRLKKEPKGEYQGRFMLLNGQQVFFPRFSGEIYEEQRVRAAIDAIARHISKLDVKFFGSAKPVTQTALKARPNMVNTWSQFLYRAATIYFAENNLILIPIDDDKKNVVGIFPVLSSRCELVVYGGIPWLRYKFRNNEYGAIELDRVGRMMRFQYKDDLRGEGNGPLWPTMELIGVQNTGVQSAVKNSSSYKFMARLTNFTSPDDIANERKRFTAKNLSAEADGGGILLLPSTYADAKQIEMKPYVVDADTIKLIDDSVNEYFGVNEAILKSEAVGDAWSAFYESIVEPWAIQFSEVLSDMLFSANEQARGSYVMATANRLQYMSNADKLQVTTQLVDRGIMTINDALEVWQLPKIEGGDVRVIRGEYVNLNDKTEATNETDD